MASIFGIDWTINLDVRFIGALSGSCAPLLGELVEYGHHSDLSVQFGPCIHVGNEIHKVALGLLLPTPWDSANISSQSYCVNHTAPTRLFTCGLAANDF